MQEFKWNNIFRLIKKPNAMKTFKPVDEYSRWTWIAKDSRPGENTDHDIRNFYEKQHGRRTYSDRRNFRNAKACFIIPIRKAK